MILLCVLQSGETALHVAARYGNVDVVSYLCSIRANPDLSDRVSARPAHAHADTRQASVRCVFDSCDQTFFCMRRSRLQEQETPLHCAAWHGYSPVARALCQAGCHVDAKNREGESALLTASARGFVDIVECLVEHGADVEATDKVIRSSRLSATDRF